MATSAPVLLLLAAGVLLHPASSLACSNCPPTTPGCGGNCHRPSYPAPGGGPPTWPSPGSGCGCGCGGGHNCPPHHKPPPGCCGGGGHCPPHHRPPPGCGCGGGHHCPPHHRPPPDCPPCNPPYVPPSYGPPTPPASPTCPIDSLKLDACVDVLSGLLHLVIGQEARAKCCPLVQGVADLDAALCLCTSLRLRLLSINLYLPVALNLLITCGKHPPSGFRCPPLEGDHRLPSLE